MTFRQFMFRQFLEDEETISKAFRRRLPVSKIFFYMLLTAGGAWFIRWLFFCSTDVAYCPYQAEGEYVYLGIGILGFYKIAQVLFFWYVNAILMTSESLLFVEWEKMFEPKSKRLDYWDLDAVEVERKGARSYVQNYGDLAFAKISGGEPIVVHKMYRPHTVEKIISANREKMVNEKNFVEQSALKDLIAGLVQTHVRENGQPDALREKAREIQAAQKNPPKKSEKKSIFPSLKKKEVHFKNEAVEVEKKLDDSGGIEIDL